MISTGNLSLQSWCYTSVRGALVRTNAITAPFLLQEEKARRETLPWELILWEAVGLSSAPRQAASLSRSGHCRQAGLVFNHHKRFVSHRCPFPARQGCGMWDGKGATRATRLPGPFFLPWVRREPAAGGQRGSSPSSPKAQLYLEANCKQSDGELLPLPINYPAAWAASGLTGTSRSSCASGGRGGSAGRRCCLSSACQVPPALPWPPSQPHSLSPAGRNAGSTAGCHGLHGQCRYSLPK